MTDPPARRCSSPLSFRGPWLDEVIVSNMAFAVAMHNVLIISGRSPWLMVELNENKTESHYRSARLVQAFKILELKMMLRFTESCHCLLSGSFILLN